MSIAEIGLTLQENCALANFFLSDPEDVNERNTQMCRTIAARPRLLSIIAKAGFDTSIWQQSYATDTMHQFVCFLITNGKRERMLNFKDVIFHTYDVDWLERYVYDLRFEQLKDVEYINHMKSRMRKT